MAILKKIWWKSRRQLNPLNGMAVRWQNHRFLLFLDDPACRWLWLTDFKEFEEVVSLSSRLLREGDTVFDIGAHYGYVATIFSAAIGTQGLVFAIEAGPHTVSRLRKQLRLADRHNVQVVSRAVGARNEIRTMQASFDGRQNYQRVIFGGSHQEAELDFLQEEILVQVTPLNTIAEEFNSHEPCLVKMDIEGGELPALQGASDLLQCSNPPWLFVEIHKAAQEKNGFSCIQLLDLIHSYSNTQYIFHENKGFLSVSPQQVQRQIEHVEYFNLLVRPPRGKYAKRAV